ncbi:MAG: SRPBCC domain-containing protein [Acidimicrobiaceae bacterium]|nr:SRPBCC domain-containing protein [Acidimicrobiaceae bacterium]
MTDSVVIERHFDAPVELVWKMWTESEHFAAWYGPTGATIPVAKMNVRVGGSRHICMAMETPNGPMQMWFVGEFIEIVANERLVYTEAMSDADGNVISPAQMGMPEGHPETTQVIVELEPVDGKTKMTMTHIGVPADSPGASGWGMAFDKLNAYLSTASR